MKIAICEDEPQIQQEIVSLLAASGKPDLDITCYPLAEELLDSVHQGFRYHLIFFDIAMNGGMDGMKAASRIREQDQEVMIVFITNFSDYMGKAFAVEAMDFLVKPIEKIKFDLTFQRCAEKYQRMNQQILLEGTRESLFLSSRDIYYLEVRRNYIYVYHRLSAEPFQMRCTMAEAEKMLGSGDFFRCHASFLVHLDYVQELFQAEKKQYCVRLADGQWQQTLPVSRDRWQEMRRAFHLFRRGNLS